MIRAAALVAICWAAPVLAVEFNLPANARQTVERNTAPDTYAAPVGVFDQGQVPRVVVEGDVRRGAWRIDSPGLTPFQVMRPLREQLDAAGFEVVLDCADDICGGFDFRFATETLPGPNMYVNIRNFHMITAVRGPRDDVQEVVALLSSATATSAYLQIIHAGELAEGQAQVVADAPLPTTPVSVSSDDLGSRLLQRGHAVLADLDFDTGSTALGPGPFDSLRRLAEFMVAQPEARIALVGHTDTVGGLQPNIGISRERARSVRRRLIDTYDIAADRMDAEGMGYLAPLASNLSNEGRDRNRRVEVVLLSNE